jgi:hypothetical protein
MNLSQKSAGCIRPALSARSLRLLRIATVGIGCGFALSRPAVAQSTPALSAPAVEAPDAQFGIVAYKTPDPAVWHRSEEGGRVVFSAALPPPDFCTITLLPSTALSGDFKAQYAAMAGEELKRLGVVKLDMRQPLQQKKLGSETAVLAQLVEGETADFHTFHSFVALRMGGQFELLAFQTSGPESYKAHAQQFQSLITGLRTADARAQTGAATVDNNPANVRRPEPPAVTAIQNRAAAPVVSMAAPVKTLQLPPLARRPGYVVGRAVFADGRPVPKFEVGVGGFDLSADASRGSMPSIGYGDGTNGHYAVQVRDSFSHTKPVDARVASVSATAHISYEGHEYKLEMRDLAGPTGMTTFLGQARNGVVRDFVLPMTGLRPGYTADEHSESRFNNAYFGALLNLDGSTSNKDDSTQEDETALTRAFPMGIIELTLTPTGPLLDGSTGQPVHFSAPTKAFVLGGDSSLRVLRGIPIGAYTATARLVLPGGDSRPLRIKDDIFRDKVWHSSIPVTWVPVERFANLSTSLFETPTLYVAQ